MMHGPMTATDAVYATPFPSHKELCDFVLYELPKRAKNIPYVMWYSELGYDNHAQLQRIFDSKCDPKVAKEAGEEINNFGGMQAMQAMYYVYCHFIGERCKDLGLDHDQWAEVFSAEAQQF